MTSNIGVPAVVSLRRTGRFKFKVKPECEKIDGRRRVVRVGSSAKMIANHAGEWAMIPNDSVVAGLIALWNVRLTIVAAMVRENYATTATTPDWMDAESDDQGQREAEH